MPSLRERISAFMKPPTREPLRASQADPLYGGVSQSVTPEDLQMYLAQAQRGILRYMQGFQDEMLARDPHLNACVSTSLDLIIEGKFAIVPYPHILTRTSLASSPEAKLAQTVADYVENELRRPEVRLDATLRHLGGAFGRGIAGVQPIVDTVGGDKIGGSRKERLLALVPIPQQRWGFDPKTGVATVDVKGDGNERDCVSVDDLGTSVVALIADASVANPSRRGYLRTVMSHWLFRNLGLGWWARFTELYGTPFRVAHYSKNDTESRNALAALMDQAGSAGYAVLPDDANIEIVDTFQRISGHSPHQILSEWSAREMSKVVLGHSQIIEVQQGTGSVQGSLASERLAVRKTNTRCLQIAQTLRQGLVFPMVARNFGIDVAVAHTPDVVLVLEQRESLLDIAKFVKTSVESGVNSIPVVEFHKMTGVRAAEDGEPTIQAIPMPGQPRPEKVGQERDSREPARKPLPRDESRPRGRRAKRRERNEKKDDSE